MRIPGELTPVVRFIGRLVVIVPLNWMVVCSFGLSVPFGPCPFVVVCDTDSTSIFPENNK